MGLRWHQYGGGAGGFSGHGRDVNPSNDVCHPPTAKRPQLAPSPTHAPCATEPGTLKAPSPTHAQPNLAPLRPHPQPCPQPMRAPPNLFSPVVLDEPAAALVVDVVPGEPALCGAKECREPAEHRHHPCARCHHGVATQSWRYGKYFSTLGELNLALLGAPSDHQPHDGRTQPRGHGRMLHRGRLDRQQCRFRRRRAVWRKSDRRRGLQNTSRLSIERP